MARSNVPLTICLKSLIIFYIIKQLHKAILYSGIGPGIGDVKSTFHVIFIVSILEKLSS